MSIFREVQDLHLLDTAEPLESNGSTCLAYKVKLYGRWQFVKRLRPELEHNTRYISLFTKEYMVGSRLNHPNLVRYNEMESSDDGLMMILDYIEGRTLTEILKNNPEYFADAVHLERFCEQLLSCLQYLHSQQVLHLDLKPDNIMITRVDEDVKLLDLGFCRTDCFTDTEGKTPGYNAPEQDANSTRMVDTRTDLYAVGKILEEIEKCITQAKSSYSLPKQYKTLMQLCLQDNPELRPKHAADCLKLISSRRNKRWIWGSVGIILVVVALLSTLYEPLRNEVQFAFRHFNLRGYLWEYQGLHINILSDDELTAEVVGWEPISADRCSPVIPVTMSYAGHEYHVTHIRESALMERSDLESISFADGVLSIGKQAFMKCTEVPFVNMPNSITVLGNDCFAYCSKVRYVHLSESLTELPDRCFHANINLPRVDVPEGVRVIGMDCFVADSALVEVNLPSTLERLNRGVFYLCKQLERIDLPAGLSYVGELCFYRCPSLKDVYCHAVNPPVIVDAFDRKDIVLHVPHESMEAYCNDPVWGKLQIVPLEE